MAYALRQKGTRALVLASITSLTLIPLLYLFNFSINADPELWLHLKEFVLPELLLNTLILGLGVSIVVSCIGIPLAWLTAQYEFPGHKFFSWSLVLPFALPAYVIAFVQVGLFDYSGPLQSLSRELGLNLDFPEIRSAGGAIYVLSLSFYPYVYLLARNAFLTQNQRLIDLGQSLGLSPSKSFFKIVLPLAAPWIGAGLILTLMETFADFGAVSVLNFNTFTTAIYKSWFSLFSLPSAAQLASFLVVIAFILLLLEQSANARKRFDNQGKKSSKKKLGALQGLAACLFASTIFSLAFLIPLTQIILWSLEVFRNDLDQRYWEYMTNSLTLALLAAFLTCILAFILSLLNKKASIAERFFIKASTLGYALPGAVLAISFYMFIVWLDEILLSLSNSNSGQILKGSLVVVLLALSTRFIAVAFAPIESAFKRISPNQINAARGLGRGQWSIFKDIYFPLLRGGIFTAALLVFIDTMKEMPITLMTRPFGWDTLSIRIFELSSEGEWERAALPSLILVLVGLIPVYVLSKQSEAL